MGEAGTFVTGDLWGDFEAMRPSPSSWHYHRAFRSVGGLRRAMSVRSS